MSGQTRDSLDALIHDVNSKCSSLKSAVNLLKGSPAQEADELLGLIVKQAEDLARIIREFDLARRA